MLTHITRSAIAFMFVTASLTSSFAQDNTTQLRTAITQLKSDNAELAKLLDYAEAVRDLASNDPVSARAARAPHSRCLNTPLRGYCSLLRGLYKVEPTQ